MRIGRLPVLLVAVGILGSGCGSTVANTQLPQGAAATAGGDGLSGVAPGDGLSAVAPGEEAVTGAFGGSTVPGAESSGAVTGSDPGSPAEPDAASATGGNAGTTPGTAGAPPVAAGSGSKAAIPLSYVILDTAGTAAFGINTGNDANSSNSAAKKEMTALVTWANANGGVGGRPIVAKDTTVSATSGEDERQAVCAKMTEDEKAQIVIDVSVFLTSYQFSCFAKHRTVLSGVATTTDAKVMREFAPYLMTTWAGVDRQLVALSDAALTLNWAEGEKAAVVYSDDQPEIRRNVNSVLIPRLKAGGVQVVEQQGMAQDPGLAGQQAAGAVLRFRREGVTRVFFIANILQYLAFTGQAKSQDYRPAYAFPDYARIAAVAAFYGTEQDNKGAIAGSTSPLVIKDDNSRQSTDGTTPTDRSKATPGVRRCLDLMTKIMGRDYYKPASSGSSKFETTYCEHFLSWVDAARTLGAAWEPARHGEAMRRLAASYPSVLNNSVDWTSGRADGASTFRAGRYDASCKCFVGAGPWRPLR